MLSKAKNLVPHESTRAHSEMLGSSAGHSLRFTVLGGPRSGLHRGRLAAVASTSLGGLHVLNRPVGGLPGVKPPVHVSHIRVAHLLESVGGECGAAT